MQNLSLLIVQNNRIFPKILKDCLSSEQFNIEIVQVQILKKYLVFYKVDLVILELNSIQELKALQYIKTEFPFIPVVITYTILKPSFFMKAMKMDVEHIIKINANFKNNFLSWLKIFLKKKECFSSEDNLEFSLVGISNSIRKLKKQITMLSKNKIPVVIYGESGTGKQVISRLIHKLSHHNYDSFIELNCSSIPYHLIESELFGYEKGAFSGAFNSYQGKLELAEKGTLLLDEIGEMDIHLQAKLLNALEGRAYYKLGSNKKLFFQGRIIAASNKNLKQMVDEKEFREDLYYRLNVISLYIPPLRDRKEDILPLVNYFTNHFMNKYSKYEIYFNDDAIKMLQAYDYPGNIRELSHIIERIIIQIQDYTVITQEHIIQSLHNDIIEYDEDQDNIKKNSICNLFNYYINFKEEDGYPILPLKTVLAQQEKMYLDYILKHHKNHTKIANALNIERSSLYRKIKTYNLQT